MKIIYIISTALFLSSCTLSMNQTDTHGTATQVGEDSPQTNPTINPNVNIPVSAAPSLPSFLTQPEKK